MNEQSNQENDPNKPNKPGERSEPQSANQGELSEFPAWCMAIFSRPDDIFDNQARGQKLFGLISMGVLVTLIIVSG